MNLKIFIYQSGLYLVLLLSIGVTARRCTERRTRYQSQSYTSYYSQSSSYSYSCGWWGWSRCRGTRYQSRSSRAYRRVTNYYTACCSGYTCSGSCDACCSPGCQNGGTCDTPNRCQCRSGWSGSVCQSDINECSGSNRCHANSRCTNTRGSYTCTCNTGYSGNGYSCSDVNECRGSNRCSSRATCRNTPGSYTCTCRTGYRGNGYSCSDVNECQGGHRCHSDASCRNTVGSYTCTCNSGYSGNGFYCNDVNECQLNTDRCHSQATCTNLVGSYSCSCNRGYQGNGLQCTDINECLTNNGGCGQICTNQIASYQCSCRVGYYLASNAHSCEDVNECAMDNGGCHHNCHNTVGSYHCSCNGGYSLSQDDHTCSVPPIPPTGVRISSISTRTAILTWQAPTITFLNELTAVSGYRIVASQNFLNISDIIVEVPSTQTRYSFPSNLEEFVLYSCEVYARNEFGYGSPSQAVQFKTLPTTPSAPPSIDSGTAQSSSVITVLWSPPPSIHINGELQYYIVNVTEILTGKNWTVIATDSVLHMGSLHPYYEYEFTITARTTGIGPYSAPVTVRTLEDAPSGPPLDLFVSNISSTSLTLTWLLPLMSERNGVIQQYDIFLQEVDTDMISEYTSLNTTFTISPLHPYYHYVAKVRAVTVSPGPYGDSVMTRLEEDAPAAGPIIITANATSPTSILLEWVPPEEEDQNGVIRMYTIHCLEEETSRSVPTFMTHNLSALVTSLHPFYMYTCEIRAFTVESGVPSDPIYVRTLEDIPSGAPLNVSLLERTPTSLTFKWQAPDPSLQNGIITEYFGYISELNIANSTINLITNSTEILADGLLPHTNYVFQVAAINSVGVGPPSSVYLSKTAEDAPSGNPNNVTVTELASDYVFLTWDPPSIHLHNGIIREYIVEVTTDEATAGIIHRTGTTSLLVSELHPDTTYYVRVAGHTVGVGPYSSPLSLHTLEDVPSSSPLELSHRNVTSTSFTLLWKPPLPENQNGQLTAYMVNFTNINSHEFQIFTTNSTFLDITLLDPFTLYSGSVSASTAVGFGPASEHHFIQTAEDAPTSPPYNLTGFAVDSRSISLSWDPPPQNSLNGVLRQYALNILEEPTERSFSFLPTANQYILTSLHPYYKYVISVAAFTVENGPFSDNVTIETHQNVPSGSPNISQLEVTSRSVFLSWDPLPPHEQNGIITGYILSITDLDEINNQTVASYFVEDALNITISELIPYTTYGVLLTAHTVVGHGPSSDLHTFQTAEEAPIGRPTNVTAIDFGSTFIHIYWSHPPEDTHYGVLREYRLNVTELETGERFRVTVDSEETEAVLTSLHPYYTYHITIVPVTVVEGDNYTEITIKTAEDAPSASPTNLFISDILSRSFQVNWDPPPLDSTNGIIRKYVLNITNLKTQVSWTEQSFNTTLRLHGVHPHNSYSVSVSAVTVRKGPYTQVMEVTTLEDIPTATPRNLSVAAVTPRSLNISWLPPPEEEQNGIITNYSIVVEEEDATVVIEIFTDELQLVIENLLPFHIYGVHVAASTSIGYGPSTAPHLIETPEDAPSSPPTDIQIVEVFSRNFTINWSPPPVNAHNGIIREYQLIITELETGRSFVRHTMEIELVISHLHPYYNYVCVVAAVTVEVGPYSENTTVLTLQSIPASAPVDVIITNTTSRSFTASWSPPPAQDHNGVITHYRVIVSRLSTSDAVSLSVSNEVITVEELLPYRQYELVISACTEEGCGPRTDGVILQTEEDAPSAPPENVTIVQITSTSLTLQWITPQEDQLNGVLSHYIIELLEMDTNTSSNISASTDTELRLEPLHPFYTYRLRVLAVTVLPGPYSEEVFATTLEDAPISPPEDVELEVNSPDSISIWWSPPLPNVTNGIIRQYSISIMAEQVWANYSEVIVVSNETELHLMGLRPHVTYHVQVRAETILPGPFSHRQSVTTLESAPVGSPSNLSVSVLTSSAVKLIWSAPDIEERNGIVRQYWIEMYEKNSSDHSFSLFREHGEESIPAVITSLHPFYYYQVRISAVTVERGPFSESISWIMPEDAPNTGPTDVAIFNITSTNFYIQWQPPQFSDQNGVIRNYSIALTDTSSGVTTHDVVPASETTYYFQNLHPSYVYNVAMAAITVSTSPYTQMISVTMAEDVPSGPPDDVKENIVNSTAVQLAWHAPLEDQRNGRIISYNISLSGNESGHMIAHYYIVENSTTFIFADLRPFSDYNVSIAASTVVGTGPFTTLLKFSTPEDVPYGSPDLVSVDVRSPTSILVKWVPPQPNEANGYIRHYLLNITERETLESHTMTVYGTVKRMDNLHPFYHYTVSVAAVTIGVGPYTDDWMVMMKEAAPSAPPTATQILEVGSRYCNVSWGPPPPEYQNGVIRSYQINLKLTTSMSYEAITTSTSNYLLSDLLPFHVYTWTVKAITLEHGPDSAPIRFETLEDAPDVPPGVFMATNITSRGFRLTWLAPTALEANGIVRSYTLSVVESKSGSKFIDELEMIATPHEMSEEFDVNFLTPYTTYNCSVAAKTVRTGPAAALQVTTAEEAPAQTPENVLVEVNGPHSINVSWNPPSAELNGLIRGYLVNLTAVDTDLTLQYISNDTSISITGLVAYSAYTIQVTAMTVDAGPFSDRIFSATPEAAPYSAPLNCSATVLSSTSINITWLPPPTDSMNGVLRYYRVIVTDPSGSNTYDVLIDSTSVSAEFNDLKPNTLYACTVTALTVDEGPPATVEIRMLEDVPSGAPSQFNKTASDTVIALSWKPLPLEEQNGVILQYQVTVIELITNRFMFFETNNTSIEVHDLHPFFWYEMLVAAETSVGRGPQSRPVTIQTEEARPSNVVGNISVAILSPTSVNVSWVPPPREFWNGIILSYSIDVHAHGPNNVSAFEQLGLQANTTEDDSFTKVIQAHGGNLANNPDPRLPYMLDLLPEESVIDDLHEFFTYHFSISLINSVGTSDPAFSSVVHLPGTEPSGPPTHVMAEASSSSSIIVSWKPPEIHEWNGIITEYLATVEVSSDGTKSEHVFTALNCWLNYTIEGLKPFTSYSISLAASSEFGTGPYSIDTTVRTFEDMPGPPVNASVHIVAESSIVMAWSVPLEENGNILLYQVTYLSDDPTLEGNSINTTTQSTILSNLTFLHYKLKVRAATSAGFGPYSEELSIDFPIQAKGSSVSGQAVANGFGWTLLLIMIIVLVVIVFVFIIWKKRRSMNYHQFNIRVEKWAENPLYKNTDDVLEMVEK